MATASQETADWIAAAMAGQKVKPGVKVAKDEQGQAGTARTEGSWVVYL